MFLVRMIGMLVRLFEVEFRNICIIGMVSSSVGVVVIIVVFDDFIVWLKLCFFIL